MSLYQEWENKIQESRSNQAQAGFFRQYLEKEADVYREILKNRQTKLAGTVKELAEKYSMDNVTFTGFLDGINTSLTEELSLEDLKEDTAIDAEIDYDKLYYNMLKVKADWLYSLPEWNGIFDDEKRRQIKMKLHADSHITVEKIGRNDPCPCGSGKKYKKCCGK